MENHILAHPEVDTCDYVAMAERACTYIVLRPGKEMTLDSLNEYLLNQRKIAKFKLPERLELVEALPLTHVGKINKKRLREMIATKVEAEEV